MAEGGASSIRDDLMRPEAFAAVAATAAVTLAETHISWVFLLDRDVFKVKRPVSMGFLDFRSLAQRRVACDAEVRLNARLAPGIYRGVVPVTRQADGRCAVGAAGEPIDWAVHMVRLPDDERGDRLLASGALTGELVDRIAARVAEFHRTAGFDDAIVRYGRAEAVARNVAENFDQTRDALGQYLTPSEIDEIAAWQLGVVRKQGARFDERIAQGRVRDGHGDLRLEHVYCDAAGTIRVLDCIEFNERFRYADVCADVAFLSMDLAAHGRADLAERLLSSYARESDDYDLYGVVDFYESYRAFVRGKVAAMLANDGGAGADARSRAAKEARRFFRLALAFHRPSLLPPSLVAVGGVIASGKSAIASRLGAAMSAPVIESDRTRKAMAGVEPLRRLNDAAWRGVYDPAFGERVYGEVLRRADIVLSSGRPVVLDASFRSAHHRRAARALAAAHGVPFHLLECTAPRDVCLARLAVREQAPSVSDGRRAIFDEFCARYEPVVELPRSEHVLVDTTLPIDATIEALWSDLGTWPRGLQG